MYWAGGDAPCTSPPRSLAMSMARTAVSAAAVGAEVSGVKASAAQGGEAEEIEKEFVGARASAELAAAQKCTGHAREHVVAAVVARLAAAQACAQAFKPVGAPSKSAHDQLDRLDGLAAGMAARRKAALARLESSTLADVSKQVAEGQKALEQLHREALERGPPPVEKLVRQVGLALRAQPGGSASLVTGEGCWRGRSRQPARPSGAWWRKGPLASGHRRTPRHAPVFEALDPSAASGGARRLAEPRDDVLLSVRRKLRDMGADPLACGAAGHPRPPPERADVR